MIYTLLNQSGIITANLGGPSVSTLKRSGEALSQTTVKGTATIEIQGRMTDSAPWTVIDTATQSNSTVSTRIAVFPQMRAVVKAVDTTATATGGVSSTPATGSISISENPSGDLDPTLIVILGTTATLAKETVTFSGAVADTETIQVVKDGADQALNFEYDTTAQPYTGTVVFSGTAVAGDNVTINDIAGNARNYVFVTAAGDNEDGTRTEVLVGNGTTEAATNFQAAVESDWLLGRIQISPTVSSSTVTLTQGALADTGESAPTEIRANNTSAITSTAWANGTTGYTLANTTYIPIGLGSGAGTEASRDATYRAFTNEIAKGNLTVVNVATSSTDVLTVEMKTPGTHHDYDASTTTALPLNLDEAADNIGIGSTDGTDGVSAIKLEINETGEVGGYTHIDRNAGEDVEMILARITSAVSATAWSGGNLTASNDYNNKSVSLLASGVSLTSFGNQTIQVVKDPHGILTTTGMSSGAAGVTVLCNLDVPQSS